MRNYHWELLRQKFPFGQADPALRATARTCDQEAGAGQPALNGNFQTQSSLEPSFRALREIQPGGAEPEASVFALTGEALANRVRAAARAADLGDGFSGHSGRIGMARRMVAAGAPNAAVQRQGRWKHGDIVARYTRGEAAGEALKWLS